MKLGALLLGATLGLASAREGFPSFENFPVSSSVNTEVRQKRDPQYSPLPPSPYSPAPYTPVGPVLLKEKPYEVKTVQALPITVAETYTTFDCRGKYANRHYADTEAGCEVEYHCNQVLTL